jgi:hypothetical protein
MNADQGRDEVCGGYLLARAIATPACLSRDLLPERILSASAHVSTVIPQPWAMRWVADAEEQRTRACAQAGLDPSALARVIDWVSAEFVRGRLGWPGVFLSLEAAREFVREFDLRGDDLALLGLGLPRHSVDEFLARQAPAEREGVPAIHAMIAAGQSATEDGLPLGYEVLGYDLGSFCSWLCNGLERDANDVLGIRPNTAGFVTSLKDATRVAAHASNPTTGAEPLWWAPWLITRYEP